MLHRFAVLPLLVLLLAGSSGRAGWETTGDWTVAAEDRLSVRQATAGATAWNPAMRLGPSWGLRADIRIRKDRGALVGSGQLIFANVKRQPLVVVSLRRRAGQLSTVEVETLGGAKRHTILTSNWLPGGDEAFAVRVTRTGQGLAVVVEGDKFLVYRERTPDLASVENLATFGLAGDTADVEFAGLRLTQPAVEPQPAVAQAERAVGDLLAHFWRGGFDQGEIVPTSHGYPAPNLPNPRGGLWERAIMAFALDTLHRATSEPPLARRLRAEWARLKRLYTPEELEAAGGPLHPACDDAGWDALYYLVLFRHTHDREALERARGLVNHAFDRWLDDELGGGLWYENEHESKSLYAVALVNAALSVAEATSDKGLEEKALGCYRWMESKLLRDDGLYWAERKRDGPVGERNPERIGEASSVTFLAGNMGMGVLHARMYRRTGEKQYLERALRTADAIAAHETVDGVLLDDRDAWTNGALAGEWAREVLSLSEMPAKHRELLVHTADSIFGRARTADGLYGGSWSGPAEGPGSRWAMVGSRPQQITTSASAVTVIAAAALAEQQAGEAKP